MDFLEKNVKLIAGLFFGLIVIGLVATFISTGSKRSEEQAQEKLAQFELEYSKYKEEWAKSSAPTPTPPAKDSKKSADIKKTEERTQADIKSHVAELGAQLAKKLNQFIAENKKSVATEMAALYLSDIYTNENKNTEALDVLKKMESHSNHLTSVLIQKKMGALLADNNQCDEALKVWDNLLKSNSAQFARAEVKIMQSLCYQKMNDLKKAEEILLSVKNDKTEGSAEYSQNADRILRLIQFKKASGT